jgi:anaerobic selenocysteine-containing dehydrogenase
MLPHTSRRAFLKNCGQFGVACTAACGLPALAAAADQGAATPPKLPELHTRAVCGLTLID